MQLADQQMYQEKGSITAVRATTGGAEAAGKKQEGWQSEPAWVTLNLYLGDRGQVRVTIMITISFLILLIFLTIVAVPVAIAAFLLKVSFKILGWLIGICFTLALLISLLLISVM